MDGAGDQFLAGSRFSQNQHGGFFTSHSLYLFQHTLQGPALSDDLLESIIRLQFFFEITSLKFGASQRFFALLPLCQVANYDKNGGSFGARDRPKHDVYWK